MVYDIGREAGTKGTLEWIADQFPITTNQARESESVNTTAFHRTNVEFGEHWSLRAWPEGNSRAKGHLAGNATIRPGDEKPVLLGPRRQP